MSPAGSLAARERIAARLSLVGAAALFSTGGAAIKSSQLSAWSVAGGRSLIAAVAFALALPQARRGARARSLPTSVAYALTLVLFVAAAKRTTAASAIFLQSISPLFLLLIGPLVLRERPTRADALSLPILAAGALLFFLDAPAASALATDPRTGNLLAAASGLTWAGTVAGLRLAQRGARVEGRDEGLGAVLLGNVVTVLVCAPFAVADLARATAHDALAISYLGLFQVGAAYVLMNYGLRSVPALEASLLLLLEPALSPAWAFLVHRERPGVLALIGGALMLAATAARASLAPKRA